MSTLKKRIAELKCSVELAQQRAVDAKNSTKEKEAILDKREGEKTTLLSRINVVQEEVDKIHKRLKDSNTKLDNALARSEESDEQRNKLKKTENDECLEEMEGNVKKAETLRAIKEHDVVESERKVVVLEGDLARAQEKYEKFAARVDVLTAEVSSMADSKLALEKNDQIASERDDENEEKVKFLETQVRQTSGNTEERKRRVATLEQLRDRLIQEIKKCRDDRKTLDEKLKEIMTIDD